MESIYLFKNCETIPVFSPANREKGIQKLREYAEIIQPIGKRKQSADTLACFENSMT